MVISLSFTQIYFLRYGIERLDIKKHPSERLFMFKVTIEPFYSSLVFKWIVDPKHHSDCEFSFNRYQIVEYLNMIPKNNTMVLFCESIVKCLWLIVMFWNGVLLPQTKLFLFFNLCETCRGTFSEMSNGTYNIPERRAKIYKNKNIL